MRSISNLLPDNRLVDLIFGLLLVCVAVLHVNSWANEPPDVDPINFMMALDQYDVSTDRPHPPGYPLFVGLARVAMLLVGKTHAYQLVNLFMLTGAGLCLYLLMRRLDHPGIGLSAAVLLLTHPLSLAATVVQESYFSDAFFGCAIVAWIVGYAKRPGQLVAGIGLIFFALGLFRAVSGAVLLPLALACVYVTADEGYQLRRIFQVVMVSLAAIIASYLITVSLAGGYQRYSEAVARVMGTAVSEVSVFAGAPAKAHLFMLLRFFSWLLLVSFPTLVVIGYLWWQRREEFRQTKVRKAALVLMSWLLPPLILYTFFYFLKPTYLLILLPPLLVVLAWGVCSVARQQKKIYRWLLVTVIAVCQLGIFYGATKSWLAPIYRISLAYFRDQDFEWMKLRNAAKSADGTRSLLVWADHPSLPIYALRLIPWSGKIVSPEAQVNGMINNEKILAGRLHRIDPVAMQWSAAENNVANFEEFDRILVVSNDEGQVVFNILMPD